MYLHLLISQLASGQKNKQNMKRWTADAGCGSLYLYNEGNMLENKENDFNGL